MPYSYPISGSNLYVTVTAVENAKVDDINETLRRLDELVKGKTYQLFDADKIADQYHIYYAAANAQYALENGNNISNKLDVETLLYASAQNQISKAIQLIGVNKETKRIAIAVITEKENDKAASKIAEQLGDINDKVLDPAPEKYGSLKQLYEITETSIETVGSDKYRALSSLITEKSALISLRR
jgi:tRNA threonylcarbamoyladenosine modification (KEOPS) complex Cgi121 subunit